MTVNSYLTEIANACILRDERNQQIKRSVVSIKSRIKNKLGSNVSDQILFGSFSRCTCLPRSYDEKSDVDLMIVFNDQTKTPQTYLNWLRDFVEQSYTRSEIKQSHPTIQLNLNHISFELVPALRTTYLDSIYKIPAPAKNWEEWVDTNPTKFNIDLLALNQIHGNLIKPLVRVLKYWNASQKYPFRSYELEQSIIAGTKSLNSHSTSLSEYFFQIVETLPLHNIPESYRYRLFRLKSKTSEVRSIETFYPLNAVDQLKQVIKPIS